MPTKKIADLPSTACRDSGHHPPAHATWPPGVYEHTCPSCGAQFRFVAEAPARPAKVTPRWDHEVYDSVILTMPPVSAADVERAIQVLQAAMEYPIPVPPHRTTPFTAEARWLPMVQFGMGKEAKNRNPYPGHVFFDSTSFRVSGWIAEATGIGLALRNEATTCAEAKVLLRRRTKIINEWCIATQADEVPGGPFEHNLCLCGGGGLQWVVNGDVVSEVAPTAGPAAAARAWVQQSTGGTNVDV